MIYKYNKLVRDKIPNIINSENGKKANWSKLSDEEFIKELNRKLLEEANEFVEENDVEELADVMEVITSIMRARGITWEEVKKVQIKKREKRGGFEDKIYLESVEENEPCKNSKINEGEER